MYDIKYDCLWAYHPMSCMFSYDHEILCDELTVNLCIFTVCVPCVDGRLMPAVGSVVWPG